MFGRMITWICLFCWFQSLLPCYGVIYGDRKQFYINRHTNGVDIKITKSIPVTNDFYSPELSFWAFDTVLEHVTGVTVYPLNNGHGISNLGDSNAIFQFFVYLENDFPFLRNVELTQFGVYFNESLEKFSIIESNLETIGGDTHLFSFYAFPNDDKYLKNITLNNCGNCQLLPIFDPKQFNYATIVGDNTTNMTIDTIPSDNVTLIIDNPLKTLSQEDQLSHKLTQIVEYSTMIRNRSSMNTDEISKIYKQLSPVSISTVDDSIIEPWINKSLIDWMSFYLGDEKSADIIVNAYDTLKDSNVNIEAAVDGTQTSPIVFSLPISQPFRYILVLPEC